MADYIDRKKLLEDLERFAPECRAAFLIIRKQNAVDAVPVVRCKDCVNGKLDEQEGIGWYFCAHHGCDWNPGNHFCSYGERRSNEAD